MSKRFVAGVGTAALLAVAGCGAHDPAPRALPPVKAAPVAVVQPTPTVEQQVEAAVRHYFAVANAAMKTGDTRELESLSLPGCGCRKLVGGIRAAYANGRSVGARFDLRAIHVHDVLGATAAAEASFHSLAYTDVDAAGTTIAKYPAGNATEDFGLVKRAGMWSMTTALLLSTQ